MSSHHSTSRCAQWTQRGGQTGLKVSGTWRRGGKLDSIEGKAPKGPPDFYLTDELREYDSTLPAFLLARLREFDSKSPPSLEGLPPNLKGLMELALAVPEERNAREPGSQPTEVTKLGRRSINLWKSIHSVLQFTGLSVSAVIAFLTGNARFRSRDFWLIVQECGVGALPIVSLISFLIGLILAFVGNVQLANFGASLYVADLVGIAMLREMGVVMTAIIMSGRTGAAFEAHLGSMKANEEIDALRTFGFDPFHFLVLPRILALILMMPILTIYANIVGIAGGMLVAALVGIPPVLYWHEILIAVDPTTASLGIFKSVFFGAAIAMSGCLQGMQADNSSAAVGEATTRAVVASITSVIVLDSAFAAIFTILGI